MQKKFLSNLFLIILLNLLVKPLAIFGIDATVQNRVGTDAYGLYFSLLNLSFLFNILMDLGINNFTTTNVAQHPTIAIRYINKLFSFRILLFIVYAIVTLSVGVIAGYRGWELNMLLVLIFNQWLVTMIAYCRSHFGGLHFFRTDAFISILDRLLLIGIAGYVLFIQRTQQNFEIEWFIWMQTAAYTLTLASAFFLLVRKIGVPRFSFHWVFSLAILKKSYPYALLVLLMMCYTRTDAVLLERIHPNGAYEAGIYAQGFRLLDASFMFGMIFANLLLPIFSKQLRSDKSAVYPLLQSARNLLIGGSIALAFVCQFNSHNILDLLYTETSAASVHCFQLLMWGFIGMCTSLIYGTLITASGNLTFLNKLSVVGILLNIALNLLMIPLYGAVGSALATLLTQFFTSIVQLLHAHKHFHFQFAFKEVLAYAGYIALLTLVSLLFQKSTFFLPIQLFTCIAGLFLFKLVDFGSLSSLVIKRNPNQ